MTKNLLAIYGKQSTLSHLHLSTIIPPLSISSPLPTFLLSYIVINQTILLSSVMCLYVQGGNERILSPSSAGFDGACRSYTHFHHPLTMLGLCFVCVCVCVCAHVVMLQIKRGLSGQLRLCCHLTLQHNESTTVILS